MSINIFYRISDKGEDKRRLDIINNENCLRNFLNEFPESDIEIVADNVTDATMQWIQKHDFKRIHRTSLGNSGSFWFAFQLALKLPSEEYVYFVENDYIHKPGAKKILLEGLKIADYVTLYDHPDKYIDGSNPQVKGGGEITKVLLTESVHWKATNSTTMTFASNVLTLYRDRFYFKLFTIGIIRKGSYFFKKLQERRFPADYRIFLFLTKLKGRKITSPIPGYSTHGDTQYLSPLCDWQNYIKNQ